MNIYIPKDHNHNPLGLFLSDSKEKVEIALASMKQDYTVIEMIDPNSNIGVNGLAFILTSKEVSYLGGVSNIEKKYRRWKRGR